MVGYRKTDNRQDFKNPLVIAYYNVDYIKNTKGTNYWRNRILKVFRLCNIISLNLFKHCRLQVAQRFVGKVTFAISSKDDHQHELNEYGIDYVKGEKPIILARDAKNQKIKMDEDFS